MHFGKVVEEKKVVQAKQAKDNNYYNANLFNHLSKIIELK
jgi:hypothetical protein